MVGLYRLRRPHRKRCLSHLMRSRNRVLSYMSVKQGEQGKRSLKCDDETLGEVVGEITNTPREE